MEQEAKERKNNVFIGKKPFMDYVTNVVMQFSTNYTNEVVILARGSFINRAVDIAEVTCKRFMDGRVEVSNTKIDSEWIKNKEGKDTVRVSVIEITLKKKPQVSERLEDEEVEDV